MKRVILYSILILLIAALVYEGCKKVQPSSETFKATHQQMIIDGWILVEGEKRNKPYIFLEGKWFLEDKDFTTKEYEIFRFLKWSKTTIEYVETSML